MSEVLVSRDDVLTFLEKERRATQVSFDRVLDGQAAIQARLSRQIDKVSNRLSE